MRAPRPRPPRFANASVIRYCITLKSRALPMRRNRHRRTRLIGRPASRARAFVMRRVPTLLACLAIFFQLFVVQTHVHGVAGFQSATGIEHVSSGVEGSAQSPRSVVVAADEHEQAPCAICQVLASAGNALATSSVKASATRSFLLVELPLAPPPLLGRTAFSWRSRAPPILS